MLVTTPIASGVVFAPLDHHDYGVIDDVCSCAICVNWRTKLLFYQTSLTKVPHSPEERDDRGCACSPECKASIKARSAYLGALHRRNLYCESSWHAAAMEPKELGEEYMRWLNQEIENRKSRTDGWWEKQGSCFPMAYWLTMFRQSVIEGMNNIVAATKDLPKANMKMIVASLGASGMV
jgi:hypothetical protein